MRERTLSSPFWYAARIFITIWLIGWSVGLVSILNGTTQLETHDMTQGIGKVGFIAAWLAGILIWYVICVGLKKVSIYRGKLCVSNFIRQDVIPLGLISDVVGSRAGNLVIIRFKENTAFGKQVTFNARPRTWTLIGNRPHPVVEELKKMAAISEWPLLAESSRSARCRISG